MLSVGATQGYPNQIPASCGSRGAITSGGGFSELYATPYYQLEADVISEYFQNVEYQPYTNSSYTPSCSGCSAVISGTFNISNRAYPDIVAWSSFVNVIIDGVSQPVAGTSVSAPVMGAMISLVNARRLEMNMSPMGFVNPFLYAFSDLFVNDITYGNNTCTEADSSTFFETSCGCCEYGYYASKGWDPVSGLGTLNYTKFLDVALNISTNSSTAVPTIPPTVAPTPSSTPASIFLEVSQELQNFPLNYSDFLQSRERYDSALTETIVNSTNTALGIIGAITSDNVLNLNVTQSPTQSSTSRQLLSISLLLTYYISTSNTKLAETSLTLALVKALQDGDFQSSLQYYSAINNVPALSHVTAELPTILNLSPTPAPTPATLPTKSQKKGKLGLILGLLFGFTAVIAVAFFAYKYKFGKSSPSKDLTRSIMQDIEIDHRLSIRSGDVTKNPITHRNNEM